MGNTERLEQLFHHLHVGDVVQRNNACDEIQKMVDQTADPTEKDRLRQGIIYHLIDLGRVYEAETIIVALRTSSNRDMQAASCFHRIEFCKKFLGDAASGKVLVCGHVAAFDLSFLCNTLDRLGIEAAFRFIDTRQLATQIPELEHHSLAAVAEYFEIPHEKAHQAKEDALTSGRILLKKLERS